MELSSSLGIVVPESTQVAFDDRYPIFSRNDGKFTGYCSSNCVDELDASDTAPGSYNPDTKQLTIYRPGVEPGFRTIMRRQGAGASIVATPVSALENAVITFGHEAAHARGIDLLLPSTAPHPAAEAAGISAWREYRRLYETDN